MAVGQEEQGNIGQVENRSPKILATPNTDRNAMLAESEARRMARIAQANAKIRRDQDAQGVPPSERIIPTKK